jgi:APA family basic amino acid/polyamine antiporter
MNNQELRRDLGYWGAVAVVVGTVIGSGIFAVPKAMVANVGSPEVVFIVWVFGGILSLFGALTYAELAAAMPEAGGEYVYLRTAYGPFFGYIYGWTQAWVAKSGSIATLATLFFYYLATFAPALERVWFTIQLPIGPGGGPLEVRQGQLCSMAVILILGFVNLFGVRVGGGVQIAVTILKVSLIFGVVIIGMTADVGTVSNYSTTVPAPGGWTGFFAALVAALWAYDGWNNVNMIASEVKNPERNLPKSLIGGVLLVIVIYLLTNMAYFFVLPAAEVAKSDRVAAEMMRRILGQPGAAAVSVAAMISIFAALNGSILSGSRVPYALARDGLFFKACAKVHPGYRTPSNSILLLSIWSSVLVLTGRYEELYTLVIFPSWILYAMATASVIVLRRTHPNMPRPYKTIGYPIVPILFVLVAGALIISTLVKSPRESILGLGIIAIGIPFYLHWRKNIPV